MKRGRNWSWEQESFVNGYNEIELKSWEYLYEFLSRHDYVYPKYIFRGHSRKSFSLNPPLARAIDPLNKNEKFKYLDNFKLAVRGRLERNYKQLSDKELWVLGHTHGLQTPLLAWTQSAYIAAFFAFYNPRRLNVKAEITPKEFREQKNLLNEPRSIFILNRSLIEEKRKQFRLDFVKSTYPKVFEKLKEMSGNLIAFNDPNFLDQYIDRITKKGSSMTLSTELLNACETATRNRDQFMVEIIQHTLMDNPGLISQACLFTHGPMDMPLEQWVQENFSDCRDEVLIKINIPNEQRNQCLKILNQMNINNLTLFPDLNGSAIYCNDLLRGLY
jgi:hypothetical protein